MAVFKPLIVDKNQQDIKKLMKNLYLFSEDLKYTISNLSLEDNVGKSVLDELDSRGNKVRQISFNSDGLIIDLKDFENGLHTSLSQTSEKIELLVQKGGVVDAMLTRMELYGEYITLKTGHIIIEAQNMRLDKSGNAFFSGDIVGGSINIKNRFIVDAQGKCYVDGTLATETLNPPGGIYADELEIYNDNEVINTVTGNIRCDESYITETLNCRQVKYTSDRRLKQDIKEITEAEAAEAVKVMVPVRYCFKETGTRSIGYIAQDLAEVSPLPMVREDGPYLELPYHSYTAIYAKMIQSNERRIQRLKRAVENCQEKRYVKL